MSGATSGARTRARRARGGGAVLVTLLALGSLGACGSDDGAGGSAEDLADGLGLGDTGGGTGSGDALGGGTVTVTFDVTGDVTVSGSTPLLTTLAKDGFDPMTCAEYAQGQPEDDGSLTFVGPAFLAGDVGGKQLLPGVAVHGYEGPGTYPADRLDGGFGGSTQLSVDDVVYTVPDGGTTDLVVEPDGSGSWTFPHLEVLDSSGVAGSTISGTMTWTCED